MTGLSTQGTGTYTVNELAAAADRIALNFGCQDGMEHRSCGYRIPRSYLGDSLELAAEMLRDASFPQKDVNKAREQVSAALANLQNGPAGAGGSLFDRAVFGAEHPLGSVLTPKPLERVDGDAIVEFHRNGVAPDNMTIHLIGDIGMDEAREAVEGAFGGWQASAQSALQPAGEAQEPRARVILVDYPRAASSTVAAGHALEPYDP